jgi:DNA repair protein RAD50
MKYHSLKMEEVNDIMRHLWNKTYQGTGAWLYALLIAY